MAERAACLVDVYDTIIICDFAAHRTEMPQLAGVAPEVWHDMYPRIGATLTVGQLSKAEFFEVMLRTCGVKPRDELVRDLVERDRELLLGTARLYPDALPFLDRLAGRGIKIAIVSNCSEHTRELLVSVGVAEIADSLVLSCEVGWMKPSARIFRHALEQVGVAAEAALFVDDQAAFCAGSEMAGIDAVQIVRGHGNAGGNGCATNVVRSLPEVEVFLT